MHIPAGVSVDYTSNKPGTHLFYVHVDGDLSFDSADGPAKMKVDTILTTPGSHFGIDGTSRNLVDINIAAYDVNSLKLSGISDKHDNDNGVIGRHTWDPKHHSLGIVTEGAVEIVGEDKTAHADLGATANAGARTITISIDDLGLVKNATDAQILNALGWDKGDLIVVGSSERKAELTLENSESEERYIRDLKVTADGVRVTLDKALEHTHGVKALDTDLDGQNETFIAPPVINMTRSVQIRSDYNTRTDADGYVDEMFMHQRYDQNDWASKSNTGHTMFMHTTDVVVEDAMFAGLGRTDKSSFIDDGSGASVDNMRGRYAVHLHMNGDEKTGIKDDADEYEGAHLSGNAVWGSLGWGYAHHGGTATLRENIAYQVSGSSFNSETGNERGAWDNNVAMTTVTGGKIIPVTETSQAEKFHDFGKGGIGFWLESRLVEVTNNTSVESNSSGIQVGGVGRDSVLVDVNTLPEGLALDLDPNADGKIHPRDIPMRVFDSNTVIGSGDVGIWVEDNLLSRSDGMLEHDVQSVMSNSVLSEVKRSSIFVTDSANWTLKDTVVSGVHLHETKGGLPQKILIGQYKEAPNFVADGVFYDKGNDPTADKFYATAFVDPFNSQGLPEYTPTFINIRSKDGYVFDGGDKNLADHNISQAPGMTEKAQFHAFHGGEDFRDHSPTRQDYIEFAAVPRVIDPTGDMIDEDRFTVILGNKSGEQAFTPTNSEGIYLTLPRLDRQNWVPDGLTASQVNNPVKRAIQDIKQKGYDDATTNKFISGDPTFIKKIETVKEDYIFETAAIRTGNFNASAESFKVWGVKIDSIGATYSPFFDEKTTPTKVGDGPGSSAKTDKNSDQMKIVFTAGHVDNLVQQNGVIVIGGEKFTIGQMAFSDRVSGDVEMVSFLIKLNGSYWNKYDVDATYDTVEFGEAKDNAGGISIRMTGDETIPENGDTRQSETFTYSEHETFEGDGRANFVMAHFGDDTISGKGGDDHLDGGGGNDTIFGGMGDDAVYGGSSRDALYGGDGNDMVSGGAGNDLIWTGAGRDVVMDGSGRDVISLEGSGRDYVLLDYDREADQVTEFAENDVLFLKNFDAYTGVQRGADFHLRANGVTEVVLKDVTTTWAELLESGRVTSGENFLEAVAALADVKQDDGPDPVEPEDPNPGTHQHPNPGTHQDDEDKSGNNDAAGRVAGRMFIDADKDGTYKDGQDTGIADRTVLLMRNGKEVAKTQTEENGYYKFDGLESGAGYSLRFLDDDGTTSFLPDASQTVGGGGNLNTGTFAIKAGEVAWHRVLLETPTGSVAGRLFVDQDEDGIRSDGDTPLSGYTVSLLKGFETVATTETNGDGLYRFDDVPVGADYSVRFHRADAGTDFAVRNGQDLGGVGNLNSAVFAVVAGETRWEAAHVLPEKEEIQENGKVSGRVYADADGVNGFDAEEDMAMAGLEVALMKGGKELARTTTGDSGSYSFDNVGPGEDYLVRIYSGPEGVIFKPSNEEVVGGAGNLNSAPFAVEGGETVWIRSEAELPTGKVAGRLYTDKDDQFGYDDTKDQPASGYKVSLLKDGEVVATTTTNDDGYFAFDNVVAGDAYSLRYFSDADGLSFLTEAGQWVGDAGNLNSVKFDVVEGQTTWQRGVMDSPARLELGTVDIETAERSDWVRIKFEQEFANDPIVVVGPLSGNGSDEATVRVRNVDETGFELHVSEWDGLDGAHMLESVSWMAATPGSHTLPDGSVVKAGRKTLENETVEEVWLGRDFDEVPLLFSSLSTTNGGQPVTTRMDAVTARKFEVAMQEAEAADGKHVAETLDWIAIVDNGDLFQSGYVTAKEEWANVDTPDNNSDMDVFLASMLTMNGPNTATLRYDEAANGSFRVRIDEETSLDPEKVHANEDINYFFAESGSYLLEA